MPWETDGSYTPVFGARRGVSAVQQAEDAGEDVDAAPFTPFLADLKAALENCLRRDGANSPIVNVSWNNKKIVNLADGAADSDAVAYGQIKNLITRVVDVYTDAHSVRLADRGRVLIMDTTAGGATYTFTLPPVAMGDKGIWVSFAQKGTNGPVTIRAASGDTINTSATYTLENDGDFVALVFDGDTRWQAIAQSGGTSSSATTVDKEQVQDWVGEMFSGNTETRITATYDDANDKINLVVDPFPAAGGGSDFDIQDDVTDSSTPANDDRFIFADQDVSGDPTRYVTFSNLITAAAANSNFPSIPDDEQVEDWVGAMFTGNTVSGITSTYDDASGKINLSVTASGGNPLTTEQVQDIVGAMFSGNTETRITATYDDTGGHIDLAVDAFPAVPNAEQIEDIVGQMFTGNTEERISATYNDSSGKINLEVDTFPDGPLTTEEVQDIVGAMFASNTETRITATYDDSGGKINLVVDSFPSLGSDITAIDTLSQTAYDAITTKSATTLYLITS